MTLPLWCHLLGLTSPRHGPLPVEAPDSTPKMIRRLTFSAGSTWSSGAIRETLRDSPLPPQTALRITPNEKTEWEVI